MENGRFTRRQGVCSRRCRWWTLLGEYHSLTTTNSRQPIMNVFPFYFLLKCIFMVWLYAPMTRGANTVWLKVVEPVMIMIEQRFDSAKGAKAD